MTPWPGLSEPLSNLSRLCAGISDLVWFLTFLRCGHKSPQIGRTKLLLYEYLVLLKVRFGHYSAQVWLAPKRAAQKLAKLRIHVVGLISNRLKETYSLKL